MIITQKTDQYSTVGAPVESTAMTIDDQGLEFIFKAFSDTLYSDKIGSIVREITSNGFDSHSEANVKKPVIIHLNSPTYGESNNGSITFEDFGVGISPDRMNNIFRKYFSSTKRGTNNEIGGFGIGSKTPLSYVNTFTIVTRYNSIEYVYLIHRGDKTPMVDLVSKEATTEGNGTQVIITIQNRRDYYSFENAIRKQLRYFDNVVINHPEFTAFNTQKIYKGKHFIFREQDPETKSGICLGKVAYPINFDLIDERSYNFNTPISLLFEIGDIEVTLNREMIDYNEKTIQKIKDKLELARQEISELYKTQGNRYDDILEYTDTYNKKPKLKIGDLLVETEGYLNSDNSRAVFTPFENTPLKVPYNPFLEYNIENKISGAKKVKVPNIGARQAFKDKKTIFRVAGKLSKRKSLYLGDVHGTFYTLSPAKLLDKECIQEIGLYNESEEDQKKYLELYRKTVLKYIIDHSFSYDRTDIPDVWLQNYLKELKSASTLIDRVNEIIVHVPDSTMTFRQHYFKTEEIQKFLSKKGKLFIYGDSEHEKSLFHLTQGLESIGYTDGGYSMFSEGKQRIFAIGKISRENIKLVKNIPGAIHVQDFIDKYPKVILRIYYRIMLGKLPHRKFAYNHSSFQFFTSEFESKVSSINAWKISLVECEKWYQSLIDYNNWDLHCFQKKVDLKELKEWGEKVFKDFEHFNLLDHMSLNGAYHNAAYHNTEFKGTEFAHKFLKITNPKNYYYAQKNLRRP